VDVCLWMCARERLVCFGFEIRSQARSSPHEVAEWVEMSWASNVGEAGCLLAIIPDTGLTVQSAVHR
jgi:hypothetical protein